MLATLFQKPMNMSLEKKNLKEDFAVCVAYVASLFLREFDEKVGTGAEKRSDNSIGNACYVGVATKATNSEATITTKTEQDRQKRKMSFVT